MYLICVLNLFNLSTTVFVWHSTLSYCNLLCSFHLILCPVSLINQVTYHSCSVNMCHVRVVNVMGSNLSSVKLQYFHDITYSYFCVPHFTVCLADRFVQENRFSFIFKPQVCTCFCLIEPFYHDFSEVQISEHHAIVGVLGTIN